MASRTQTKFQRHLPSSQAGFTLVEIMVGLAIGMLATLIVMQVFTVFEAQKRTTTGAGDAQTNGNIALYTIARDLKQAGFALMPTSLPTINSPLKCAALIVDGVADASVPNRVFPIAITNGAASDTIRIRYGDSDTGGNPLTIVKMGPSVNLPTANDAETGDSYGCTKGSRTLVLSQDGLSCSLSTASDVTAASGVIPGYVTLTDASVAAGGANVSCLGNWSEITYAVNNGNLERNGDPVLEGIVNLQAQYGISAAGKVKTNPDFNTVVAWVDPDAVSGFDAPSVANRIRIKAVRIAVIARNARKETKDPATGLCNTTVSCTALNDPAATGLCAWAGSASSPAPAVDLSASDPDWACYRYRVFETVIPLRNVIWSKEQL